MTDSQTFYDDFAEDYHLIFNDWEGALVRQAVVVDALLREALGAGTHTVLDCACGIGTQALGLAKRGHTVTGTDISPKAVERAAREALAREITAAFAVADMRTLGAAVTDTFDAVIAFDNALPHLMTDTDLDQATASVYERVREGGAFLASIRDYDALLADRPTATSHRVIETDVGRRVVFQVWDWNTDDTYAVTQFIVQPDGDDWTMHHYTGAYRALRREVLTGSLQRAGFRDVRWVMPDDSDYYQPVVIAWR